MDTVSALEFSDLGNSIIVSRLTIRGDLKCGSLSLIDLKHGDEIQVPVTAPAGIVALAVQSGSPNVVIGGFDGTITALTAPSGHPSWSRTFAGFPIQSLRACARDGTVSVICGFPGKPGKLVILNARTGATIAGLGIMTPFGLSSACPPNRNVVVFSSGSELTSVDVGTRKVLWTRHMLSGEVKAIAFAASRLRLAVATDHGIEIRDAAAEKTIRTFPFQFESSELVAFSGSLTLAAIIREGSTIEILDVGRGLTLRKFKSEGSRIVTILFSPDGSTLAAGGLEGDVRVWKVDSGQEVWPRK